MSHPERDRVPGDELALGGPRPAGAHGVRAPRRTGSAASLVMLALALGVAFASRPVGLSAQIEISGQLDLVATARADSLGINSAFRGDNPFNPVRLRLYARRWVTDRIGIFTELLYDADASPRVNGAYVVVNQILDRPWLNARLGLAPNVIGSFGLRSTYFNANPLVGIPLVWQYRTNLSSDGEATAGGLTAATSEPGSGMPILYDACWSIQWELLGELGAFEYSLAVTPGALSNPIKARSVDGFQWLARVGYVPLQGLRLGLSGAHGPYLSPPSADPGGALPYAEDPSSFDQALVGFDLEYQHGAWLVHSELFGSRWESPLVADDLDVVGGYAEIRYDLAPGWYLAGRAGGLFFGDVVTDPLTGARAAWDRDAHRTEVALGYRVAREVLLKLDWQRTTARGTGFEQNLFSAQLSSVF